MPLGDIFDQAVLTETIVRSRAMDNTVPGQAALTGLGARIAPLVDVRSNAVRMRIVEDNQLGLGQFRAPEGSYPLVSRNLTAREEMIELVQLAEKIRISEVQKMRSVDPQVQRDALNNLITDGQWLLNRNALLTNYMRWKALENGSLNITYPSGGTITIDYGYDNDHVVTASTLWSDADASIIDDLEAWKQLIVDDAGTTEIMVHMSTRIWNYMFKNAEIKSYLGAQGRAYTLPTREDVVTLTQTQNIVLYDEVYRDASGTSHRFWPDNKILMTGGGGGYSVGGLRIAEMLNGLVPISVGQQEVQFVLGPQSESYLDIESNTQFLRVGSARMMRINMPEAIVIATVL